jgi:hypothetical protein
LTNSCARTGGSVLLELKHITEEQLWRALCLQLHINFFDLDTIAPDTSLRALINPHFAEAQRVAIALSRTLLVARLNSTMTWDHASALQRVRKHTGAKRG